MAIDKSAMAAAKATVNVEHFPERELIAAQAIEAYLAALPTTSAWNEPPLTCPHIDAAVATGELSPAVIAELSAIRDINSQLRYGTWALKDQLAAHPAPSEPVSDGLVRFDGVTMTPAAAANRIAELEHRSLAEGWRPIETAPKNTEAPDIMLYGSYLYPGDKVATEFLSIGRWVGCTGPNAITDGWEDHEGVHADGFFTHWMPLPQPPEAK